MHQQLSVVAPVGSGLSPIAGGRTVVHGWRAARVRRNWLCSAAFGSFAYVGRDVCREIEEGSPHLYLSLEVGERCQLRCRHCIYHAEEPSGGTPSPLVERRLFEALHNGLDPLWISFSGKEPTLFPESLLRMAARARKPGRTLILMTNGLRLQGSLLRDLAEHIDYFDISLDGDREAHDWMRGEGTFDITWRNIHRVLEQTDRRVGVMATLVKARLPSGRPQYEDLTALARRLSAEFGNDNERVTFCISLYKGLLGDPLLLDANEVTNLVRNLCEVDFPARVLFTANYAHLWPEVRRRMGWRAGDLVYDAQTSNALHRNGNVNCVLFNLTVNEQIGLRLANDDLVYLSCSHLLLGEECSRVSIADMADEDLGTVSQRAVADEMRFSRSLEYVPADCVSCEHWHECQGGDRLLGIYFDEAPADPYCPLIARG